MTEPDDLDRFIAENLTDPVFRGALWVIHMTDCDECRRWPRVCAERAMFNVSEDGMWFPLPGDEDRRRYLCDFGMEIVPRPA